DEFLKVLGDPAELYAAGKNPIKVYIHLFRQALVEDKKMCLCGLLGAESDSLPDKVLVETRLFFERNIAWLTQAHTAIATGSKEAAKRKAIQTIAILEGAILISKTLDDNQIFEEAVLDLSS
ncbi:MAG: TetR/AcrR family transcriptional repressor of nem operon, partial [Paraglaciecola psychrophila]